MKRIAILTIFVVFAMSVIPTQARSTDESYVIGRITGAQRELPGYFKNNSRLQARDIDRVEFPGLRLLREVDGKKFLIRPNHEGFFYQDLPGGRYTLARKRNDKPDYREPNIIEILEFEVKPERLVNLGTINIILDDEPVESLFHLGHSARGKYIYRYHYEREADENAYNIPLNWFKTKKHKIAAAFKDRVDQESKAVTTGKDGSRVVLREIGRFEDK